MENAPLLSRLRLYAPIVQAPMAGVTTPQLAAAVCEAGALGSLGIGAMGAEAARETIRQTRALTAKPFNVNVFAHRARKSNPALDARWADRLDPLFARYGAAAPRRLEAIYPSFEDAPAPLDMLCEEKPGVVSFHFGCPSHHAVSRLKASGAVLLASATSLAEACALEAAGMDAVVAQGIEAGGHRGVFDEDGPDEALPLDALLAALVPALSIPVIAAGGLMDGTDVARVISKGAVVAQLGTAFVAAPESAAGPHYRERLAVAQPGETRMVRTISGRPARGFQTDFTRAVELFAEETPPYPQAYDAHKRLAAAASAKGDPTLAAMWAGSEAHRSRAMPAVELVRTLENERAAAASA